MRGNNHRRGQEVPNHQPRYLVLAYLDLLLTKWKVLGRQHAIKSFRRIAKNKRIPSSLFVCQVFKWVCHLQMSHGVKVKLNVALQETKPFWQQQSKHL